MNHDSSVSDAINIFEQASLHEDLQIEQHGRCLQPEELQQVSFADFEASRAQTLEASSALYDICAVSFARGLSGFHWCEEVQNHAIRDFIGFLGYNARQQLTMEEAWLEMYDGLDHTDEAIKLLSVDVINTLKIHMLYCQLREIERTQIDERVDLPQDPETFNDDMLDNSKLGEAEATTEEEAREPKPVPPSTKLDAREVENVEHRSKPSVTATEAQRGESAHTRSEASADAWKVAQSHNTKTRSESPSTRPEAQVAFPITKSSTSAVQSCSKAQQSPQSRAEPLHVFKYINYLGEISSSDYTSADLPEADVRPARQFTQNRAANHVIENYGRRQLQQTRGDSPQRNINDPEVARIQSALEQFEDAPIQEQAESSEENSQQLSGQDASIYLSTGDPAASVQSVGANVLETRSNATASAEATLPEATVNKPTGFTKTALETELTENDPPATDPSLDDEVVEAITMAASLAVDHDGSKAEATSKDVASTSDKTSFAARSEAQDPAFSQVTAGSDEDDESEFPFPQPPLERIAVGPAFANVNKSPADMTQRPGVYGAKKSVMPNLAVVKPVISDKKRKGERKYRSLPELGISLTISIKKAATKPTLVVVLNDRVPSLAVGRDPPTDTIGVSVLIVRFALPSSIFPKLPMAEAKVETRIESLAQLMDIALELKTAAKDKWPSKEQSWKWQSRGRFFTNTPVYRRMVGTKEPVGRQPVEEDVNDIEKEAKLSLAWIIWDMICWFVDAVFAG